MRTYEEIQEQRRQYRHLMVNIPSEQAAILLILDESIQELQYAISSALQGISGTVPGLSPSSGARVPFNPELIQTSPTSDGGRSMEEATTLKSTQTKPTPSGYMGVRDTGRTVPDFTGLREAITKTSDAPVRPITMDDIDAAFAPVPQQTEHRGDPAYTAMKDGRTYQATPQPEAPPTEQWQYQQEPGGWLIWNDKRRQGFYVVNEDSAKLACYILNSLTQSQPCEQHNWSVRSAVGDTFKVANCNQCKAWMIGGLVLLPQHGEGTK